MWTVEQGLPKLRVRHTAIDRVLSAMLVGAICGGAAAPIPSSFEAERRNDGRGIEMMTRPAVPVGSRWGGDQKRSPPLPRIAASRADRAAIRQGTVDCESGSAEQQIRGCRIAIDSGLLKGRRLAWAYGQLGAALSAQGAVEAAIDAFSKAIELDPENADYRLGSAAAFRKAGQPDRAVAAYGEVLRLLPADRTARYGRGQALLELGERARALDDFMVAHTEACRDQEQDFIKDWQASLQRQGGYGGGADGTCGEPWRLAIVASALGISPRDAAARGYALYDPAALSKALVGTTIERSGGYLWPFGEPEPGVSIQPSAAARAAGVAAQVRVQIDGTEGRSGLELWVYRSIAEAQRNWEAMVVPPDDLTFEKRTGERTSSSGADRRTRKILCARRYPFADGPPTSRLRCGHWPLEGQVAIMGFVEDVPQSDEDRLFELMVATSAAVMVGARALQEMETLLLRERETQAQPPEDTKPITPETSQGPGGPPVGDPAQLTEAIEALDLTQVSWPAPYRMPDKPVVTPANEAARAKGVHAVVVFPMSHLGGATALFLTVFDSPASARQAVGAGPLLGRASPEGADPVSSRDRWPAAGVENGEVACDYQPLKDPSRTGHYQCLFLDPASQVIIGTVIQGVTNGPASTVEDFKQASLTLGGTVWAALRPNGSAPPQPLVPADEPPPAPAETAVDPAAIVAALSEPGFMAAFGQALGAHAPSKEPFQAPQRLVFQASDAVSRARGVVGRAVILMNGPDTQNGVEFFVYRAADVAARHLPLLLVTPESIVVQGTHDLDSSRVVMQSASEGPGRTLTFDCARARGRDDHQPRQVRCAHHAPGSQIAVTAYSYFGGPVGGRVLDLAANAAAPVLAVAEARARRIESPQPSLPDAGAGGAPGRPDDAPAQSVLAVERINQAAAGSQAFVATDGGTAVRLLVTDRLSLGRGARLRIERRACLALLLFDTSQGVECRRNDSFKPYSLEIDLAMLDPGSIAIERETRSVGARGLSVRMACAGGSRCARITSDDQYAQIFARGFAEALDRPRLFLPCATHESCARIAQDLRGLAGLGQDPTALPQTGRASRPVRK